MNQSPQAGLPSPLLTASLLIFLLTYLHSQATPAGEQSHIYQLPADLVPSKYSDIFWFYDFFSFLFIISSTHFPYKITVPTFNCSFPLILFSSFLNSHLFLSLYLHLYLPPTFSFFLSLISISALVLVFPSTSHTVESGKSILMSGCVFSVYFWFADMVQKTGGLIGG